MKTSQRILTDILREKVGYRLYVLDLLLDENSIFHLWKYYGDRNSDNLTKRKVISSEHYEVAFNTYRNTLDKKLKKKDFRRLDDGEAVLSPALGKILTAGENKPKKPPKPTPKQEEHRKLSL